MTHCRSHRDPLSGPCKNDTRAAQLPVARGSSMAMAVVSPRTMVRDSPPEQCRSRHLLLPRPRAGRPMTSDIAPRPDFLFGLMRVHCDLRYEQAILAGPGRPFMEVDTAWFVRSYAPALKARTVGMTIGLPSASFNTFIPNTGNRQPQGGGWRRRSNLNVCFGSFLAVQRNSSPTAASERNGFASV